MANGGADTADLGENEYDNISNWSISKLISSLKSAFRPTVFSKAEAVLVAREDKSKREIEALKQEKDLFFYKSEEERLEKMSFESELKKCKKECEEMRNAVSKLREENMVLRKREKSAEERCKKLLEEVKRIGEKDKEMIDLRSRNCELECEKAKAENEMEILRKRFEELDKRVSSLESDLRFLSNQEDLKDNEIGGESRSLKNVGVKFDVKVEEVSFGPSCDSPVKANGNPQNAGSERPPSQSIIQIVDSDDECAPVETLSEKGMALLCPADNSHADRIGVQNGSPTLKRKRTSCIIVRENENGDNDDNSLTGSVKMKKCEEPVCKPDDCPLNPCSKATITSDSNEVDKGFSTPREDFMVSRQCEQQMESEQKSQNLMNGFPLDGLGFMEESSCSSDSDSDDDNDGVHIFFNNSQLAPEARRENRN
ncbi:uncharacterized protein LOC110425573 [Herrania umbratica]|uniref:Uncharacterized protein LOC110425573 n=1 Tax=Herrania umbratica TaxID=108875 RepID=A0A6J1BA31_9ROSI|nr:uncharacterized protein LOC110425573 [Herrania umbratica]